MFSLLKPVRLRYRRFQRRLTLSKRQQFVGIVIILTLMLLLTQLVPIEYRNAFVLLLSVLTFLLVSFALREDLNGVEWFTLLALPVLFTFGLTMYYFLLPVRWLTRIPVAMLYAVGIYAIILTENIYNVAVNRTIALLRAAHSVGFLMSIVTFYLLTQWSLINSPSMFFRITSTTVFSWVLYLQLFWSVGLAPKISQDIIRLSVASAFVIGELTGIFIFWPVNPTISALFLTTAFYAMAGLVQQYLMEKLYRRTLWEYLSVLLVVLLVVFLGTNWYVMP